MRIPSLHTPTTITNVPEALPRFAAGWHRGRAAPDNDNNDDNVKAAAVRNPVHQPMHPQSRCMRPVKHFHLAAEQIYPGWSEQRPFPSA